MFPPLPPAAYLGPAVHPLPFPLDHPAARTWRMGRHALWQGIRALGLRPGDGVLVPAYHHGSEIEAYVRAGVEPHFYDPGSELEPDHGAIELPAGARVRALHLTHYLGRPAAVERWRAWCDAHDLRLVEDAAQGWLGRHPDGRPLGATGDAAIFSLFKSVAVPDGGALALRHGPMPPRPLEHSLGLRHLAGRHRAWAVSRLAMLAAVAAPRDRGSYDAVADFDLGDPWAAASLMTRRLLPRLARPEVAPTRLAHYRRLAAALETHVPDGFRHLPDGASPFGLPVRTPDKATARERLAANGIEAVDAWRTPHPRLAETRFPAMRRWRAETLLLPVHQSLTHADLERIAAVAGDVLGELQRTAEARQARATRHSPAVEAGSPPPLVPAAAGGTEP